MCQGCHVVKEEAEFPRRYDRPSGLRSRCKECQTRAHVSYARERRSRDPDFKQKHREAQERWRKENPGSSYMQRRREHNVRYQKENRTRINAHNRLRYATDATCRAKKAQYRNTRRARKKGSTGELTYREWEFLKEQCDHRCLRCGKMGVDLVRDHVVALVNGGTNGPENIQPLCRCCNARKQDRTEDYRPLGWVSSPSSL